MSPANFSRLLLGALLLALTACGPDGHPAENYSVAGIDVSRYQGAVNWERAIATGDLSFAFVKATEGGDYRDPLFLRNWEILHTNRLRRGAYHFYRPEVDAATQAQNYIARVEELLPGDLPPVLDVEMRGNLPNAELIAEIQEWLLLVEARFGVKPILYSGQKFYNRFLAGHFAEYPIWIARYSNEIPVLADGRAFQFWQYLDAGRLPGIIGPVDLNIFAGTPLELAKLCIPSQRDPNAPVPMVRNQ